MLPSSSTFSADEIDVDEARGVALRAAALVGVHEETLAELRKYAPGLGARAWLRLALERDDARRAARAVRAA